MFGAWNEPAPAGPEKPPPCGWAIRTLPGSTRGPAGAAGGAGGATDIRGSGCDTPAGAGSGAVVHSARETGSGSGADIGAGGAAWASLSGSPAGPCTSTVPGGGATPPAAAPRAATRARTAGVGGRAIVCPVALSVKSNAPSGRS